MPVPANPAAQGGPSPKSLARRRQAEALAPAWSRWLSGLDQDQRDVLEKYKLVQNGAPVIVPYKDPTPSRRDFSFTNANGQERYMDSNISLAAAQRLMALDPTPNHAWTDWIFFQAGGGKDAKRLVPAIVASMEAGLRSTHRVRLGRERGLSGDPNRWPAQQRTQIETELDAIIADRHADAVKLAENAPESMLENLTSQAKGGTPFGFVYDFNSYRLQGGDRYRAVEEAITSFFSVYKKAVEMNEIVSDPNRADDLEAKNVSPVPLTPDEIDSVQEMRDIVRRVKEFWQARAARADVRVGRWKEKTTVYDDDNVTLIVPLTYAAAVRFGSDAWPWANKNTFLSDVKQARSSQWQSILNSGIVGYMTIHAPIGSYTKGMGSGVRRARFNFVALVASEHRVRVYTEDGQTMDYDAFINAIRSFAAPPQQPPPQQPDPQQPGGQEEPVVRAAGIPHPIVPSTRKRSAEQIESVVASIESAIDELHQFTQTFDRRQLVPDVSRIDITQPQGTPQGD